MNTGDAEPVLAVLRSRAASVFGHPDVSFEPVAVFERPFSTVIRLRVLTPEQAPSYAFTKIYKVRPVRPYETPRTSAEVVRLEFAATRHLHAALAGRPGFSTPRPIASLPEHGTIVTGELEGTPLDVALRHARLGSTAVLQSVATRVAAWLHAYQGAVTAGPAAWRAGDARAYLDDRLRHITPDALAPSARAHALALFDDLAGRLPADTVPAVSIHADLCPANVLVTRGGGIGVLDFATAQDGTRFHDIAHLYLHLAFAQRRARRRIDVDAVQRALLAGFERASAVRDPLFRLMLLQHVVCHVTQLADETHWRPRAAVRALVRWRWQACMALPPLQDRHEPARRSIAAAA
jgi:tRNA A-37 threonylcarbamoyl transferase component Bud32